MEILKTVLLGILQGVTEFLPVSSSAHLVAAQHVLDIHFEGVFLEVALHFGTLMAIVLVFWRDLLALARDGLLGTWTWLRTRDAAAVAEHAPRFATALAIVLGTVPIGLAGVFLEDTLEQAFESLMASGVFLCITGLLLLASRRAGDAHTDTVSVPRGLAIGLAQATALLPGISRSGSTIVAGYFLGVEPKTAARFSFLLAVPALVGATVLESYRALSTSSATMPSAGLLGLGALVSAAVGTVCLLMLLRVIQRGRLHWFAAYCLPAGLAMMTLAAWT